MPNRIQQMFGNDLAERIEWIAECEGKPSLPFLRQLVSEALDWHQLGSRGSPWLTPEVIEAAFRLVLTPVAIVMIAAIALNVIRYWLS